MRKTDHMTFPGGRGELPRLVEQTDWSATPLGAMDQWPETLRTVAAIVLGAGQPMMLMWGPQRTLLYNDAYATILGEKHPAALGRPFDEVWAEVLPQVGAMVDAAFAGEPVHRPNIRVTLTRHGRPEEAHFSFSYTPIRDAADAVLGVLCVCVETTSLARTTARLQSQSELLEALVDNIPVLLCIWDARLQKFRFNAKFREVLGWTEDEANAGDFMAMAYPDPAYRDRVVRYMQSLQPGFTDWKTTAKDGTQVDISWANVQLSDETFVGIGVDIRPRLAAKAQLRESEAKLKRIFHAAPVAIALHEGPEHRYTFTNPAYDEFIGRDGLLGKALRDALPELQGQKIYQQFDTVYRTGHPLYLPEYHVRLPGPDGAAREGDYRRVLQPWFAPDGSVAGVMSFTFDITEHVEAREALRAARDELEQRVAERTAELQQQTARLQRLAAELTTTEHRERKRLAAMLHDDLQQLLVAAKMRLSQLRSRTQEDALLRAVDSVGDALDQAVESSRGLTRQLRPPVLYEDGLVPALRWLAGDVAQRHGLEVAVEAERSDVPLDDDAKAMLYTCVRELLLNVRHHGSATAVTLRVGETARGYQILVEDGPLGEHLDAAEHETDDLPGLGLFGIRERLAALGGDMTVASEPDGRTQITMLLPMNRPAADVSEGPAAAAHGGGDRSPRPGGPVRLLVVDDHKIVRQGIAFVLGDDERLEVVAEAADGLEALDAVQQHQPEVVLIDVNMPRMNGVEATREIRRRFPGVRVVGMSVQDDEATASSMLSAGAAVFVRKADDFDRMTAAILGLRLEA